MTNDWMSCLTSAMRRASACAWSSSGLNTILDRSQVARHSYLTSSTPLTSTGVVVAVSSKVSPSVRAKRRNTRKRSPGSQPAARARMRMLRARSGSASASATAARHNSSTVGSVPADRPGTSVSPATAAGGQPMAASEPVIRATKTTACPRARFMSVQQPRNRFALLDADGVQALLRRSISLLSPLGSPALVLRTRGRDRLSLHPCVPMGVQKEGQQYERPDLAAGGGTGRGEVEIDPRERREPPSPARRAVPAGAVQRGGARGGEKRRGHGGRAW